MTFVDVFIYNLLFAVAGLACGFVTAYVVLLIFDSEKHEE